MNKDLAEPLLDFASSDARAGFRLQRFEVYNWGTFDGRVWALEPRGENGLLTGDIGSGKSTLVDALTTLLVPAHRVAYNKAAGADSRERTLRSYVLGYFKSERSETGLATKAVALRDLNSYSVILGHFFNEGYGQHVTLAQVFYARDRHAGQPARTFVVADRPLTIAGDFADFGSDVADLRKRLRGADGVELFDSFPPYGAAFRRRFGIDSDQALELFHQTVSLKSVGNLTDFVRGHMLEPFPAEERIQALIAHFDDLDRAHRAVLDAKAKIAALEPLCANAGRHDELAQAAAELRDCRDALRPWFAELKSGLLRERIERLDGELARLAAGADRLTETCGALRVERDETVQAIRANGGDRLERLKADAARLERELGDRRRRAEEYRRLAHEVELPGGPDAEGFAGNQAEIERMLAALRGVEAEIQNRMTDARVALRDLGEERDALATEIESLRGRRSNVPARMLALRERLAEAIGASADELPFAGELLAVRDDERDWEGAAERLLHHLGLSLLVPDALYRDVAAWVDRTHLSGRLVYYRVLEPAGAAAVPEHPDALFHKLQIRESPFFLWLERELARRFDHVCCSDLESFRREKKAMMRSGQTKTAGERHEKDDRHALDDRSRYVLGWSNESKLAALRDQAAALVRRIEAEERRHEAVEREQRELRGRGDALTRLAMFRDFHELDWKPLAVEIDRLEGERRELEAASDVLRTLQGQLTELERRLTGTEKELQALHEAKAVAGDKRETAGRMLADAETLLAATPAEARARLFPRLAELRHEALGEHRLTVESCDNRQSDVRDWLQARIDAEEKKLARLRDQIVDAMRRYKTDWPAETAEVDVSLDAAPEYGRMLADLVADDLPRFEERFKALLNENTIREVAGFQAQLNREREEILARIETIDRSLRQIDYNPGRYICLVAEPAQDPDVREFRESLRACTEGALTGSEDEQYSEAKFLAVQAIIERFRGREGRTDLDARWTGKVTDVRNWFTFSASERWREDDAEHEHYTDSGGKSGGQKEKLAYTVLAASLAYQFGLEWGEQRSRSFRFVVIDEAFGRGSDESTRYGLELFRRLNLQLLIVTPLQKIHVIEPFVASVGFVHNEDGRRSMLRNLTIEEYRAEKEARRATP